MNEFNCQPGGSTPNWIEFDAIEIQPCMTLIIEGSNFIEPWDGEGVPEFWTTYGHISDKEIGGVEALHDSNTQEEAMAVAVYCAEQINKVTGKCCDILELGL